jgi:uncharacterized glyoxalase superfamily protein PhnB
LQGRAGVAGASPRDAKEVSDMAASVRPVPDGFNTLSPYLVVKDAPRAIEFYKKAFGAEEMYRSTMPGSGVVMNAQLRFGNSMLMLNEEFPQWGSKSPRSLGGSPVTVHLYVDDADKAYERAVQAGAEATMPLMDAFWGDRFGKLRDPFGHEWSIATRKENLAPAEIARRAEQWFANMPKKGH